MSMNTSEPHSDDSAQLARIGQLVHYIGLVYFTGVVIVGFVVNFISLIHEGCVKKRRSSAAQYLMAISASALCSLITLLSSMTIKAGLLNAPLVPSNLVCKLTTYAGYTGSFTNPWFIAMLTLERFLVVHAPFLRHKMVTAKRTRYVIGGITTIAMIYNSWQLYAFAWIPSGFLFRSTANRLAITHAFNNLTTTKLTLNQTVTKRLQQFQPRMNSTTPPGDPLLRESHICFVKLHMLPTLQAFNVLDFVLVLTIPLTMVVVLNVLIVIKLARRPISSSNDERQQHQITSLKELGCWNENGYTPPPIIRNNNIEQKMGDHGSIVSLTAGNQGTQHCIRHRQPPNLNFPYYSSIPNVSATNRSIPHEINSKQSQSSPWTYQPISGDLGKPSVPPKQDLLLPPTKQHRKGSLSSKTKHCNRSSEFEKSRTCPQLLRGVATETGNAEWNNGIRHQKDQTRTAEFQRRKYYGRSISDFILKKLPIPLSPIETSNSSDSKHSIEGSYHKRNSSKFSYWWRTGTVLRCRRIKRCSLLRKNRRLQSSRNNSSKDAVIKRLLLVSVTYLLFNVPTYIFRLLDHFDHQRATMFHFVARFVGHLLFCTQFPLHYILYSNVVPDSVLPGLARYLRKLSRGQSLPGSMVDHPKPAQNQNCRNNQKDMVMKSSKINRLKINIVHQRINSELEECSAGEGVPSRKPQNIVPPPNNKSSNGDPFQLNPIVQPRAVIYCNHGGMGDEDFHRTSRRNKLTQELQQFAVNQTRKPARQLPGMNVRIIADIGL